MLNRHFASCALSASIVLKNFRKYCSEKIIIALLFVSLFGDWANTFPQPVTENAIWVALHFFPGAPAYVDAS